MENIDDVTATEALFFFSQALQVQGPSLSQAVHADLVIPVSALFADLRRGKVIFPFYSTTGLNFPFVAGRDIVSLQKEAGFFLRPRGGNFLFSA